MLGFSSPRQGHLVAKIVTALAACAAALAPALAGPACGGNGGGGGAEGGSSDASGAVSTTITPDAGGTLTSADGRLTLVVPPHAVSKVTTISIAPLDATNLYPSPFPAGVAYQMSPDGLTFASPATLTFRFQRAELAAAVGTRPSPDGTGSGLAGTDFMVPVYPITRSADGTASPLANAVIDTTAMANPSSDEPLTVTADVAHFSGYWFWFGWDAVWLEPRLLTLETGMADNTNPRVLVQNYDSDYYAYVNSVSLRQSSSQNQLPLSGIETSALPVWVPPASTVPLAITELCNAEGAQGWWYAGVKVWQAWGPYGAIGQDGGPTRTPGDGGTGVWSADTWYGVTIWDWSQYQCTTHVSNDAAPPPPPPPSADAGDAGDAADGSDAPAACSSQGTALATGQSPLYLASDGVNVYWTDPTHGEVLACAVGGCKGQPTVLASGLLAPYDIRTDGNDVYWTDKSDGVIRSVPTSGGATVVEAHTYMVPGSSTQGTVLIDSPLLGLEQSPQGDFFYAEVDSPSTTYLLQIYACSKTGLGCAKVAGASTSVDWPTNNGPLGLLAIDSSQVYWISGNGGASGTSQFYALPFAGTTGQLNPLGTAPDQAGSYMAAGTPSGTSASLLYASDPAGYLYSYPTQGTYPVPSTTVGADWGGPFALDVAAGYLYAPALASPQGVSVIAIPTSGGGTRQTIFTDACASPSITGITFDASQVYIGDCPSSSGCGQGGRVVALAKP